MGDPKWQALLNWTLKNSMPTASDSSDRSKFKKMSKEDLEFLTKALESTKEAERQLEAAIKDTASFTRGEFQLDDEKILENLNLIESYLDEHPDHSLDIAKNEILNTLMKLIQSKNIEISNLTLRILTSALGNNEIVSKEAFNRGLLELLINRANDLDDISPIISTTSALISSYPNSGMNFGKLGGYNLINRIFTENRTKRAQEKSAMLIYHLVNNKVADLKSLKIDQIIGSILPFKDENLQHREICGEMILTILLNYPGQVDLEKLKHLIDINYSKWDSDVLKEQLKQIKILFKTN